MGSYLVPYTGCSDALLACMISSTRNTVLHSNSLKGVSLSRSRATNLHTQHRDLLRDLGIEVIE